MDQDLTIYIAIFFPGVLATVRSHRSIGSIWVLNLIALGATAALLVPLAILVWLIALVWAASGNTARNEQKLAQALNAAMKQERRHNAA